MLIELVWFVLSLIFNSIPLYFAVKIVGGETTFPKTILVNLTGWIIGGIAFFFFDFLGLVIGAIFMTIVYKFSFKLSFLKAIGMWLLAGLIAFVIILALAVFLGVTLFAGISSLGI